MNLNELEKILTGQPAFYLKEAQRAVFKNLISDWNEATALPAELRKELNKKCPLMINTEIFESGDTQKALITLNDGCKIETVLMLHQGANDRNTVCVSSQAGCPMGCKFCATGRNGFQRNLEAAEIVEQVVFFARLLKNPSTASPEAGLRPGQERVNNIVFMGMGEPFLNFENVTNAILILNGKDGLNIGARHISLSTIGITEGIDKMADFPLQINLAISLHAPNDMLREQIIPAGKKYPIEKIIGAAARYIEKTGRQIMVEYLMIEDFNNSESCARELASLLRKLKKGLYIVNLIEYNPTGAFKASRSGAIKKFRQILEHNGVKANQRWKFGRGVKGACGQLAGGQ